MARQVGGVTGVTACVRCERPGRVVMGCMGHGPVENSAGPTLFRLAGPISMVKNIIFQYFNYSKLAKYKS
jgi:hypothetical protein